MDLSSQPNGVLSKLNAAPKGPGVLPSHENVAVTDTNSKTRVRLLVKNLLLSPLKLLSYIASFYASLLENISVGLGDYWLECEAEKNRLKKQTITYFKNSKIENSHYLHQIGLVDLEPILFLLKNQKQLNG